MVNMSAALHTWHFVPEKDLYLAFNLDQIEGMLLKLEQCDRQNMVSFTALVSVEKHYSKHDLLLCVSN